VITRRENPGKKCDIPRVTLPIIEICEIVNIGKPICRG
jgi:hypothetical protein